MSWNVFDDQRKAESDTGQTIVQVEAHEQNEEGDE